jgi:hypothetical protein
MLDALVRATLDPATGVVGDRGDPGGALGAALSNRDRGSDELREVRHALFCVGRKMPAPPPEAVRALQAPLHEARKRGATFTCPNRTADQRGALTTAGEGHDHTFARLPGLAARSPGPGGPSAARASDP